MDLSYPDFDANLQACVAVFTHRIVLVEFKLVSKIIHSSILRSSDVRAMFSVAFSTSRSFECFFKAQRLFQLLVEFADQWLQVDLEI